nr:MAG TPA: hypothetical protein [Crassvirales sp.]
MQSVAHFHTLVPYWGFLSSTKYFYYGSYTRRI